MCHRAGARHGVRSATGDQQPPDAWPDTAGRRAWLLTHGADLQPVPKHNLSVIQTALRSTSDQSSANIDFTLRSPE